MPTRQISLDEASWRLEQSGISGSAFAALLVKSPPLLLGLSHGNELRDSIDLSGVTGVRIEPDDIVVAENVMWTKVQVDWMQLRAAFKKRGQPVSWWFACNITPERLERSRRPDLTRLELMRSAQRPAPAS